MAEEILKSAEFRGTKKSDGEDPIIVAQRFLNIFKQLHIFTQEKKDNFDQMIMALPSEIRGTFSSIPGGSVLQEYVDELEKKSGKTRDKSLDAVNANILESAKKEAESPRQGTTSAEPIVGVRAAVDADFAKELANALVQAGVGGGDNTKLLKQFMLISEDSRRKDNAEMARIVTESQLKMAQMMVQHNVMNASNATSANNNANNIQIHTAGAFPPVEELVGKIAKVQTEMFSDMTRAQTKEISAIISVALKEGQQLSAKTIVDALKVFQKENLKLLSGKFKVEEYDVEPREEYVEIEVGEGDAIPEGAEFVEEVIEPSRKNKKKDKKNKREKKESAEEKIGYEYALDPELFGFNEDEENERVEDALEEETAEDFVEFEEEFSPEPAPVFVAPKILDMPLEDEKEIEESFNENFLDLAYFDDIDIFANGPVNLDEIHDLEAAKSEWGFDAGKEPEPAVEVKPAESEIPEIKTSEAEEEWEWQEIVEDTPIVPDVEEIADFEAKLVSPVEEQVFYEDEISHTEESIPTAEDVSLANNEEVDFKFVEGEDSEWEWEYEEEVKPIETTLESPKAEEEGEWEWEYEEGLEPIETAPESPKAEEEGEWEWEYEEEDEPAVAASESEEDGEWEWEYEEVPEGEDMPSTNSLEIPPTQPSTNP